jgi:hypothetical protein
MWERSDVDHSLLGRLKYTLNRSLSARIVTEEVIHKDR